MKRERYATSGLLCLLEIAMQRRRTAPAVLFLVVLGCGTSNPPTDRAGDGGIANDAGDVQGRDMGLTRDAAPSADSATPVDARVDTAIPVDAGADTDRFVDAAPDDGCTEDVTVQHAVAGLDDRLGILQRDTGRVLSLRSMRSYPSGGHMVLSPELETLQVFELRSGGGDVVHVHVHGDVPEGNLRDYTYHPELDRFFLLVDDPAAASQRVVASVELTADEARFVTHRIESRVSSPGVEFRYIAGLPGGRLALLSPFSGISHLDVGRSVVTETSVRSLLEPLPDEWMHDFEGSRLISYALEDLGGFLQPRIQTLSLEGGGSWSTAIGGGDVPESQPSVEVGTQYPWAAYDAELDRLFVRHTRERGSIGGPITVGTLVAFDFEDAMWTQLSDELDPVE
ncbi:MAG: hypothetical protein AAF411_03765, partial [Myxococcota bacterium]